MGTWATHLRVRQLLPVPSQVVESGILDKLSTEERKRQEVRPPSAPGRDECHAMPPPPPPPATAASPCGPSPGQTLSPPVPWWTPRQPREDPTTFPAAFPAGLSG